MALPKDVTSGHTVYVERPGRRPAKVRYAVAGERLVCFGDDGLSTIPDGATVHAAVHDLHFGPPLFTFDAHVRELAPEDVDREALLELLAHVPLGRSLAEVEATVEVQRTTRRVVELSV